MTDLRRAGLSAALLISASVIFAACGGATATPTPAAAGEATPTEPTAAATPTPEQPGGEASPELAIPTFDLEALGGVIPGVDSYRTSFSVGGEEQYQSVVVTKPVLSKAITTFSDGEVSGRIVIIDDETWVANGPDGAFESVPAELASSMLFAFDPALLLGAYTGLDWATGSENLGTEEKNGVQARHVRIDPSSLIGAAQMPAGSSIDVWVAEAGYLVAWEMSGFAEGEDVSIQVSGVNDPANKVDRPS